MIRLKCIDDPFETHFFNSIVCFADEHDFYDCVGREFLPVSAFAHLEHTFNMYLLIGDSNEWIGYVLLYNDDLINGYKNFAFSKLLYLLGDIDNLIFDVKSRKKLSEIRNLLYQNRESPNFLSLLYDSISSLRDISDSMQADDIITEYYYQLNNYLKMAPKYLYLDVVIALPKDEKIININKNDNVNLLMENKYYGFISETMALIEAEINRNFSNTPIFLQNGSEMYAVNCDDLPNKQKLKQYFFKK